MAKSKRELQAELEAANKRIAELSQSNQNANSNFNNDEPPSWLKTFLEAQLSMQRQTQEQNFGNQRQMQLESQRQIQQIIERFSQQQLPQSANSERSKSREQTADINSFKNKSKFSPAACFLFICQFKYQFNSRQDELKRMHKSLPHCRWEFC